ncbi:hypothetical protein ABFT80_06110 [Mesorhizobium sp. SB112]|uniref:hypothetical protein n=1 Tax=Mesorhizobium sp. SB112 TaxID=3151853 RepID=UPI0032648E34
MTSAKAFAISERPAKTGSATGERLRPLWIPRAEAVTVKQALAVFEKDYRLSEDTLRRLVKQFALANQTMLGAPLRISAPGLAMVLDGDHNALDLLRQDDRQHSDVVRYFRRLGIPVE